MLINWLILSLLAYFINASASVIDKVLISKEIPHPFSYTFFVGFISVTAVIFAPFGFFIPPLSILVIALFSGAVFLLALFLFFTALHKSEASRVLITTGGLTPVFTFLLSILFLKETLNPWQLAAFFLLILGGVLINLNRESFKHRVKFLKTTISASFFFALSFVLTKFVFLHQPFFNGFVWIRLGSFLVAISFLISKDLRRKIFQIGKKTKEKISLIFIGNKSLAGLSFVLLNLAISKGNVALVNALQGIQYVFVFIFTLFLSLNFPQLLKEKINSRLLVQKILAICLIVFGFSILWFH